MIHDYETGSTFTPRITAALLTNNRHDDLAKALEALSLQSLTLHAIVVVDAANQAAAHTLAKKYEKVRYIPSEANLGGAGGFSLAILSALATGADYVWVMDDDACPENNDVLSRLIAGLKLHGLAAVSPLVVAPEDHTKLAFPYPASGGVTYERAMVAKKDLIPQFAQLFNGFLVHRDVFFTVGLPDMKLFIRGDEVDFLLRMRKAGIRFGTITNVAVSHPPGWSEMHKVLSNRLNALVPEGDFKRYYFFRNRGYLARRHRRIRSFVADCIGYPIVFIWVRRGDWAGLRQWWGAFSDGLRNRFGPPTRRP